MTPQDLAQIAGVALALALAYIPKLARWYEPKTKPEKAQIVGLLLILSAVVIFALSCAGLGDLVGLGVACTQAGAIGLVRILLAALIANQATFVIAVRPFQARAS